MNLFVKKANGGLADLEREAVVAEIRKLPWFSNYVRKFGEEPDLSVNADYDYVTAFKSGALPDETDHWPSYTPDGKTRLKREGHPTLWKTLFMDKTGLDPDKIGIKNEQEGQAYIQQWKQLQDYYLQKKAQGGSVYTPAEQDLLRRYADGGPVKRPTLPADRSADYKQEGEEENRLLRFFEAAARELPDAIKQNVTSNADLASKYLKFKFGMMSPEEVMRVAKMLPESIKGMVANAVQFAKEVPRAVAEATPESAGRFTSQLVAGELTDPVRIGRAARAVTKPVMAELDVYHGTPHRFPATEANPLGEFDASKIGTGEGAQAYGHGIYFAESPGVAESYKKVLTDKKSADLWTDELRQQLPQSLTKKEFERFSDLNVKLSKNGNLSPQEMEEWRNFKNLQQEYNDAVGRLQPRGSLYKADLPDEMIDRMLDWDKPLSEQPAAVRESLRKLGKEHPLMFGPPDKLWKFRDAINDPNLTGAQIYKQFEDLFGSQKVSGALMRQAGIPGIRYLDAGSRGQGGSGTRNFVVFPGEEKKVRILERK